MAAHRRRRRRPARSAQRTWSGPLRSPAARARAGCALLLAALAGVLGGQFVLAGPGDHPARGPARAPAPSARTQAAAAGAGSVAVTGARGAIGRLEARLRFTPDQPALLTRLGTAYLARASETANPAWYPKAGAALARSNALNRDEPSTLTALGRLEVARHDFREALGWGRRAHALDPGGAGPLGVVFDAQVELGSYRDAATTAQTMVERAPGLASFERLARIRQLYGDSAGALSAMEWAATSTPGAAGAGAQALVGDLRLGRGELAEAADAYRRTLRLAPGYQPAEVGLGRIAIVGGDLDTAAKLLAPAAAGQPLPATVALLGDVRDLLGQRAAAARQYRLVRAIEARNRAGGVAVDLELARFEAGHARERGGDPAHAVELAQRALRRRPSIDAEDTLALALRADGRSRQALEHARAAVRLGTRDAVLWYHLAAIEADLGQAAAARRHLAGAIEIDPFLMGPSATVADRAGALSLATRLGMRVPGLEAGGVPR